MKKKKSETTFIVAAWIDASQDGDGDPKLMSDKMGGGFCISSGVLISEDKDDVILARDYFPNADDAGLDQVRWRLRIAKRDIGMMKRVKI